MLTDVPTRSNLPTQPRRSFPMMRVTRLDDVRAFYVDKLGCPITFDMPNYLQVQLTPLGEEGPELAFMADPSHPTENSNPLILSVPVPDADAVQARLDEAGVSIASRAADKPWGWRSLHVVDPSGLVLDFFHKLGHTPSGATS